MSIKEYINQPRYTYRIKTIMPLDNPAMDKIDTVLMKYDPLDGSKPKKTILQTHPLDFVQIPCAEVWVMDIVTGLPCSTYQLHSELRNILQIPDHYIIVRTPNDPTEIESEKLVANREMEQEAKDKGLKKQAMLNTDPASQPWTDAANSFGNDYNISFLEYLKRIADERPSRVIDPKNPLFQWLEMPKADPGEDFNADIPGVRPIRTKNAKAVNPALGTGIRGNFDNSAMTYERTFETEKGKTKELSRSVGVETK